MPDLLDRLDDLEPPVDIDGGWADVRRRVVRRRAVRGGLVAVAAVALLVGGVALLAQPGGDEAERITTEPPAEAASGWTRLPDAPIHPRELAHGVWSGEELYVVGGQAIEVTADGVSVPPDADPNEVAAYHPATRTWRLLPPAPVGSAVNADGVWTGEELVVVGDGGSDGDATDAAAYDPATDAWRSLPAIDAPDVGGELVWTGEQAVVTGVGTYLALDLDDGTAWEPLPDPPVPPALDGSDALAWTGELLLAFGSAPTDAGGTPATAAVSAYDPATRTWSEPSRALLGAAGGSATWTGSVLVAVDHDRRAAAFDPSAGRWSPLPDIPVRFSECYTSVVAVGEVLVAGYCPAMAVAAEPGATWTPVTYPDGPRPYGDLLGTDGERVYLAGDDGFWSYRPPPTDQYGAIPADLPLLVGSSLLTELPDGATDVHTSIEVERDLTIANLGLDDGGRCILASGPPGAMDTERAFAEIEHGDARPPGGPDGVAHDWTWSSQPGVDQQWVACPTQEQTVALRQVVEEAPPSL